MQMQIQIRLNEKWVWRVLTAGLLVLPHVEVAIRFSGA